MSSAGAALASDASIVLIFAPSSRGLTVDLSKLACPYIESRWYSPESGEYLAAGNSPYRPVGNQTLTPATSGDWVLVLKSMP